MAISKILNMKDCGGHFHGKHLKRSLDYVMNPEKTQDGRLIGAINCQVDSAFEQMKATKRKFGKVDKRQGYHILENHMRQYMWCMIIQHMFIHILYLTV